jgi:hypothetical protein
MKIWIVKRYKKQIPTILGIYSTEELAYKTIDNNQNNTPQWWNYYSYSFQVCTLDASS